VTLWLWIGVIYAAGTVLAVLFFMGAGRNAPTCPCERCERGER
jgi:hypothetical protein